MSTLYVKRGRRYYPVGEYGNEAVDMLPYGSHLVAVFPGQRTITYQVEPDHAGLLTAIQQHEKTLVNAIKAASSLRIENRSGSPKERRAIKAYQDIMGPEGMLIITRPAALNVLDGLKKAIVDTRRSDDKKHQDDPRHKKQPDPLP